MLKLTRVVLMVMVASLVSAVSLHADVRTQERTQVKFEGALGRIAGMFGGKAAREGIVTTVALKGDRLMTSNDMTGEIIDLAEEKIYQLDMRRKSYSVLTFAEYRRQMEEAMAKAKDETRDEAPAEQGSGKEYEVDFTVKQTGQSKTIAGLGAQESIATVTVREKGKRVEDGGFVLDVALWMTTEADALNELTAFRQRYAQQLLGIDPAQAQADMRQAMAMYPQMQKALERFRAEAGKLKGTPLSTVMTFQVVGSPQGDDTAEKNDAPPTSVGGLLGGLGRRMGRGKTAEPTTTGTPGRSTVLTSTTETLQLGTAVAAGDVAVPAGFKEKK
ncbi:MAG: hypothetical protein FJW29_08270 [Acidobacteria bacterium]|nr:hypothetical protein [Acidobacteriota bacterium]